MKHGTNVWIEQKAPQALIDRLDDCERLYKSLRSASVTYPTDKWDPCASLRDDFWEKKNSVN